MILKFYWNVATSPEKLPKTNSVPSTSLNVKLPDIYDTYPLFQVPLNRNNTSPYFIKTQIKKDHGPILQNS